MASLVINFFKLVNIENFYLITSFQPLVPIELMIFLTIIDNIFVSSFQNI